MTEENEVFNKGDKVPSGGKYVCSPCGFQKDYEAGEEFGECTSCLAGTEEGKEEYVGGTGLWEKVNNKPLPQEE